MNIDNNKFVTVAEFEFEPQAHMARIILEEEGIGAQISNAFLPFPVAAFDSMIKLSVIQDDVKRAKKILKENNVI